ncbi:MAG TPA: PepSY domain-containing protein [Gemmatimonadaceae bacterium]|jgi:hypothetical protein
MKYRSLASLLAIAFGTVVATAPVAAAQQYKKDIPDSLAKQTKIAEPAAAAVAQKRIPTGKIDGVELEREDGHLMYSYDIKIPGKSGIEEVNVNALTGKIIGVEHESAAEEAKEAAEDAKAAAAKAKPKKP